MLRYLFYAFQGIFILCVLAVIGWILWRRYSHKVSDKLKIYLRRSFYIFQTLFVICVLLVIFKGWKITSTRLLPGGNKEFYFDFEETKDIEFFEADDRVQLSQSRVNVIRGEHSMKIFFPGGHAFPGPAWEVFSGREEFDWSRGEYLRCGIFNPHNRNVEIKIKVKSGNAYPKKSGEVSVSIPASSLKEINIPLSRFHVRKDKISYFKIYMNHPYEDTVLYIDELQVISDKI